MSDLRERLTAKIAELRKRAMFSSRSQDERLFQIADELEALLVEPETPAEIDWKRVALAVLTSWSGNDGAWIGAGKIPKEWVAKINREVEKRLDEDIRRLNEEGRRRRIGSGE
jgi:hypothetical protein